MPTSIRRLLACLALHGLSLLIIAPLSYLLTLNTVWRWAPLTTEVYLDTDKGQIKWLNKFLGLPSSVTLVDTTGMAVRRELPSQQRPGAQWLYLSSRCSSLDLLACRTAIRDSAGCPDMKLRNAFWSLREQAGTKSKRGGQLSRLSALAEGEALRRALALLRSSRDMDYAISYLDLVRAECMSEHGELGIADLPGYTAFNRDCLLFDHHPLAASAPSAAMELELALSTGSLRRGGFRLKR